MATATTSAICIAHSNGMGEVDRINHNGANAMNHHAELTAVRWLLARLIARYNQGEAGITLGDLHALVADLVQMQSEMIVL